jgi:Protein of unknown function (DUF3826)
MTIRFMLLAIAATAALSFSAQETQKTGGQSAAGTNSVAAQPEEKAAAYLRTISERFEKTVAALGIADSGRSNLVLGIVVQQYRGLSDIHFARDVQIENAKAAAGNDKAAIQAARDETKPALDKLHGEFLAKLSAELSPEQVDKVKDGMTYGVVHVTYNVYLKMYPELTEEQKRQIMAWLVEARELAMDQGTSNEKHAVFGKYKGRINNYLSKAGYDAKKGEQNLKKAAQPAFQPKDK